ncbi:uncharacterized protein LOC131929668 isoform X2 [Physella acuta]|uniref:uncharacterized protein LOC131929668 isoform X2 n=1 Tax=Physella acuta TaxID=109671 RepID=UPI0027DCFD7A|nr:uncharacterized protein LOC131929668 isoform X2 [Physella acuta]
MDDSEKINLRYIYVNLATKENIIAWLMRFGLIAKRYKCPVCHDDMKFTVSTTTDDGFEWSCSKSDGTYSDKTVRSSCTENHSINRSLRKGTIFEKSTLPLQDIILLTYLWCKKVNLQAMMKEVKASEEAIREWMTFCRDTTVELCMAENETIGGPGVLVDLDEGKIKNLNYLQGQKVTDKWAYIGAEQGSNKYFICIVHERTKEELLNFIKNYIKPGSVILSDCWRTYKCLKDKNFLQATAIHSVELKSHGTYTTFIRRIGNGVKKVTAEGFRHVNGHCDPYLLEYFWRRKNTKGKLIFNALLKSVAGLFPPDTEDSDESS